MKAYIYDDARVVYLVDGPNELNGWIIKFQQPPALGTIPRKENIIGIWRLADIVGEGPVTQPSGFVGPFGEGK